jgi:hypothetical protein
MDISALAEVTDRAADRHAAIRRDKRLRNRCTGLSGGDDVDE